MNQFQYAVTENNENIPVIINIIESTEQPKDY